MKLGAYTSCPYSVATGYLNKDSILDIAVANFATHNVGVLLGYGNGTFSKEIIFSTGIESYPYSVGIGDFNNDKQSDIVVANAGTHNVGLRLGYGDGTFAGQICFSMGSAIPISIAIGDLNTDAYLDIAVVGYGTNQIYVFLGNGNGSFELPMIHAGGYGVILSSIAIADVNHDNQLDVVISDSGTGTVVIFLGCGNGTLVNSKIYSTGIASVPISIVIADFNYDHKLDLAVANTGNDTILIMLGFGNGSFQLEASISLIQGSNLHSLVVSDFNNDNKLDIAIANTNRRSIGILTGYGDGNFADQVEHPSGAASQPMSIVAGDFNHDNYIDIAIADNGTHTVGILIASITGLGGERVTSVKNGSNPLAIGDGDFNNDTYLDIAVANSNTSTIDILLGHGDGRLIAFVTYSTGIGSYPQCITIADLNYDGRLDIIIANGGTDNLGIFLGYGNGTFSDLMIYSTGNGSNPSSVAIGDFNSDSYADITVANVDTNSFGIFYGYGNGNFTAQTSYSTGDFSQPGSIVVGDFNNDHLQDILVSLIQTNELKLFLGYGNGSFHEPSSYTTESSVTSVILALGDFNNDTNLDVAGVIQEKFELYVSLGNGNGTIGIPKRYRTGALSFPVDIVVSDLNNDSILDIVVANYIANNVGLFYGYGNGTFMSQQTVSTRLSHPSSIVASDFNNDGWIDIAVSHDLSNTIVIIFGNYQISFQSLVSYLTGSGSHPYFVAVTDFNNDTKPDIGIANSIAQNIGLLHGLGNASFSVGETYSTGSDSIPFAFVIADFNKDNQLDIAFVNYYGFTFGLLLGFGNGSFGNMTTYSAGVETTRTSIAASDLNNDTRLDIVVTQSSTSNIEIFFGQDYTNFFDLQAYSTGYLSNPTKVVVGDFNNDNHLDLSVTNLAGNNIGIFLGFGDGTFENQITYSSNNGYGPFFIGLGDFNNDTWLDIAVLYQYPNGIGILLGHGNGTFNSTVTLSIGTDSNPDYLIISDFNNDDELDIAIMNIGGNNIGVFLGYGDGTFMALMVINTYEDAALSAIVAGDFNNDGFKDIGVTILNNSSVGILLGYGNGTFREIIKYPMQTNATDLNFIAIGDFNGDKQLDLVVVDATARIIGIFLGHGDGIFSHVSTYSTGFWSDPSSVIVSDLNNDKQDDICVLNQYISSFMIFYGYGNGNFAPLKTYPIGNEGSNFSFAVGDLNHDNKLDMVIAIPNTDTVEVLLASDSEPFSDSVLFVTGTDSLPYFVVVGDFNNDDRKDIAVANSGTNNVGILIGNGNGTFQSMITYTTGNRSFPIGLAIGHVNHDNCLDIAVVNRDAGNIGIFLGKCDGTFQGQVSYLVEQGSTSLPVSIAFGDFNNDNSTDIAVANYGSNTVGVLLGYGNGSFAKSALYPVRFNSNPFSVDVGDFNQDGWMDIVEANLAKDNLVILLNLCEL
ncbi:unnamed protein product [Rotaria magnacalcarata]